MGKKCIEISARFSTSGIITPKVIHWEDGRNFSVDRIIDVQRAASLKAGCLGMRYICEVHGKEVLLFNDDNKWFMEVDD